LEQKNAELRCQAALGRYTVDMRHNLNNALTSVLGNAELLMLDDQTLGRQACLQVETIRTMALRIHEFLQRFTSIENEMNASENVSAAQIPTNGARVTSASSLS
jgi:signal transduction histidine kinase